MRAAVAPESPVRDERAPRRRRLTGWDLGVLVAANAAIVVGLWWRQRGLSEIHDTAGLLTSVGRVTGMLGALLALVQLLLLARVPVLDTVALDRVAAWHRRNGIACLVLLVAHTVLITAGYALADRVTVTREVSDLLGGYPGVALATAGLGLLVAVAVTSAPAVRRRLGARGWHAIHLSTYLAVALAFSHQLATGHEFQRQPVARAYWWALYAATLAALVAFRVVLPIVRSLVTHRLHVTSVEPAARGVVAVEIGGRGLDRLGARSGQYLHWRFLAPGHRLRARTLSLAAAPDGRRLRIAARDGDGDGGGGAPALAALRPGTRVIVEGPAGGLTSAARRRPRVALIAAGAGLTPVRALLEDLPGDPGEIAAICRAARRDAVPFGAELDELARRRGAALHWVLGDEALSPERLLALVPDIAERDVYLCGPVAMVGATRASLLRAGVAPRQILSEGFGA
jgi:ferredoxin-NADP reductase/DMSO/TMAO reductase YedYZ heme-binding membrane subunit